MAIIVEEFVDTLGSGLSAKSPYGTECGSVATDCFLDGAGVDFGVAFGVEFVDLVENIELTLPKKLVFLVGAFGFC